jgi:hypothetical protein
LRRGNHVSPASPSSESAGTSWFPPSPLACRPQSTHDRLGSPRWPAAA